MVGALQMKEARMFLRKYAGLIVSLVTITTASFAQGKDQFPVHIEKFDRSCITVDNLRGVIEAKGGEWFEFTHLQFAFLSEIYANSSQNKSHALPRGDKAAVFITAGVNTGLVVFIDDNKVCSGMQTNFEVLKHAAEMK